MNKVLQEFLVSKFTCNFTAMGFSQEPLDFDGPKVVETAGFLAPMVDYKCGITLLYIGDNLLWGINSDTHYIQKIDLFMELLIKFTNLFITQSETASQEGLKGAKL